VSAPTRFCLTKFRALLRRLREEAPPLLPVQVRRLLVADAQAECALRNGYFYIQIDPRLSWESTVDALLHEWAHALAWQEGPYVEDHGPEWGLAYARCYTIYTEE